MKKIIVTGLFFSCFIKGSELVELNQGTHIFGKNYKTITPFDYHAICTAFVTKDFKSGSFHPTEMAIIKQNNLREIVEKIEEFRINNPKRDTTLDFLIQFSNIHASEEEQICIAYRKAFIKSDDNGAQKLIMPQGVTLSIDAQIEMLKGKKQNLTVTQVLANIERSRGGYPIVWPVVEKEEEKKRGFVLISVACDVLKLQRLT